MFTFLFKYIEVAGSSSQESSGLGDVAIEVLHLLLSYILTSEEKVISDEQLDAFLNSLRKDFPQERVPAVLAPLLYPHKQQEDIPLVADLEVCSLLKLSTVRGSFK